MTHFLQAPTGTGQQDTQWIKHSSEKTICLVRTKVIRLTESNCSLGSTTNLSFQIQQAEWPILCSSLHEIGHCYDQVLTFGYPNPLSWTEL